MRLDDQGYKRSFNLEGIADKLIALFVHRIDSYYKQLDDGRWVHVKDPLTKDVVLAHLNGDVTIGPCLIRKGDDSAKFLAFDVDPEAVKDPTGAAKRIASFCVNAWGEEFVLLIATRHPDPSFHVFIPFVDPVPADVVRWLGKRALEKTDAKGVEIFPKQDRLVGEYGNTIRLPLGFHRKARKWSRALDVETFELLPNEVVLNVYPAMLADYQVTQVKALMKLERERTITQYADVERKGLDAMGQVQAQAPLSNEEEERIVRWLMKYWKPGRRNKLEMYFLGLCLKKGVSHSSAYRIIDEVCRRTNDEEYYDRLRLVNYHYERRTKVPLKAKSGLREILEELRYGFSG